MTIVHPSLLREKKKTKPMYFTLYGRLFNSEAASQPLEAIHQKTLSLGEITQHQRFEILGKLTPSFNFSYPK